MTTNPDGDTTSYHRKPSEHSLAAMTDIERMLYALGDCREETRQGFNSVNKRINEIDKQLIQGGQSIAIMSMQVKELIADMAQTDTAVKTLEANDWTRSVNERNAEKQSQPKQFSVAVTAAIIALVTLLINGFGFLVYHMIKSAP